MSPTVQQILSDAREQLRTLYGERVSHVILYGSQARGDARPDSDVDVLVVLSGDVDQAREIVRLVDVELRLLDRYGLHVHLLPVAEVRYADEGHPLMMNVRREGVEV